jgi:hypothetical protein
MSNSLQKKFDQFAKSVRAGELGPRREYSLSLAHGVFQALCCGYKKITAIEFGVAEGDGLRQLSTVAEYLQKEFQMEIQVIGFDTGTGLPDVDDYRDHPEIWSQGEYCMNQDSISLPPSTRLILGDVKDTIFEFVKTFDGIIGFVSIDLDLYSSTKSAMPLFEMPAERYLPATPVYVDDINTIITYNPWCGEPLALTEFNNNHTFRKFEEKNVCWKIQNFHVFHVLDHPIRNGVEKPLHPLTIQPF